MISRKIKIECVITCVNYDDFLAITLPYTIPHVDHLTVVTSTSDKDTQALCRHHGVRCLPTDCFYRESNGSMVFNKSRGINYGLANLRCHDWILHLDADIVLPLWTRRMLMNADLQEDCIYGIDRINCPSHKAWTEYNKSPNLQFQQGWMVSPPNTPWKMGSRIVHGSYGGYCPIGFFQLWHGSQIKRYPEVQDADSEHTDLLHAIQWSRTKRVLLPEIIAIHLESEPAPMGTNWKGRSTKRFGDTPSPLTPTASYTP